MLGVPNQSSSNKSKEPASKKTIVSSSLTQTSAVFARRASSLLKSNCLLPQLVSRWTCGNTKETITIIKSIQKMRSAIEMKRALQTARDQGSTVLLRRSPIARIATITKSCRVAPRENALLETIAAASTARARSEGGTRISTGAA